jgi:hypothetical protein
MPTVQQVQHDHSVRVSSMVVPAACADGSPDVIKAHHEWAFYLFGKPGRVAVGLNKHYFYQYE